MKTKIYDPFNPVNQKIKCPSCSGAFLETDGKTVRKCKLCGRIERLKKPQRKELGDRRYQRLIARQKKKFGALKEIKLQWIADPETAQT